MPHSAKAKPRPREVKSKEKLSDESLLDLVQRQTFLYFWEGAEPVSGLARDRKSGGWRTPRTMTSQRAAPALQ